MKRNFSIFAASGVYKRGAKKLALGPLFRGYPSMCVALKCSLFLVKSLSSALIIFFKADQN